MDRKRLKELFPTSHKDLTTLIGIMLCATLWCGAMRLLGYYGEFPSLIYVMAVLLVSRFTTGYLYGLTASLVGVLCVNFLFTYPYRAFNFLLAGYPLTFVTMMVVSIVTCAMTNQIKQQERLKRENEMEKTRANLLRSVSHDIRTPLTSIVGATSTILENRGLLTDREQDLLLKDVRDEAQWLIRVVENLLSVTRMGDNGAAQITKVPEVAEEVMGAAVSKFRKRFPGVGVSVELPEDLLLVPMDAILIEQVLGNLMENAVIHGKTTSKICLSVRREEETAVFAVSDNGDGIPEQQLPTLFDGTLRQSGEHGGDQKRNMGLGLAVCRAIVTAHGGRMTAQNLPAGGAEVGFVLPAPQEEWQTEMEELE